MATRAITLTNTPQLVTSKSAFIESYGGNFYFAFGTTAPTDLSACHENNSIDLDNSFGNLYAWKVGSASVKLIVSEKV